MIKEITNLLFQYYQPGFQFVESITPQYPVTTGTFVIPEKQYTTIDTKLLSGTSMLILISQASLIAVVDNIYHRRIPELADIELCSIQDIKSFCEKAVVCKYEQIKYNKVIWRNDPDKHFEITVKNIYRKKHGELIFLDFDFSVANDKHIGSATTCYVKNDFFSPY